MKTLVFDLSEVLIAGLIGIEKPLSLRLQAPEESVLPAFAGEHLDDLCRGILTEDEYLTRILEEQGWEIAATNLKSVIRENLRREVPGMKDLVRTLAGPYELILLSDHAREWVEHVMETHAFLALFDLRVFSFETGTLKKDVSTFHSLLKRVDRQPQDCLFVDDSEMNVGVARSIGIPSIQFRGSEGLIDEMQRHGIAGRP